MWYNAFAEHQRQHSYIHISTMPLARWLFSDKHCGGKGRSFYKGDNIIWKEVKE